MNFRTSRIIINKYLFEIFIIAIIITSTLVVYYQVTGYGFIHYDDYEYVQNNSFVLQGLKTDSIQWAFTSLGYESNWHPITWISLMLDTELYGPNPGMYHFTNVIIHILNSLLLFLLFSHLTSEKWKSAAVAILFALHPIHVESVAWISERKDVLSTFWGMLTMWMYVRYVDRHTIKRYTLSLIFYAIGLMSKPMLVTLPFVLLLLDYWPLRRFELSKDNSKFTNKWTRITYFQHNRAYFLIKEKIPFFILAVLSCYITFLAQKIGGSVSDVNVLPLSSRIPNAIISYCLYLWHMLWPLHLAFFYPYPKYFNIMYVLGAFLLLVLITIFSILFSRRYPYLIMGWIWYLCTLGPVIGIVQVGSQSMADRYSYIPLIGISIMLIWGTADLLDKKDYGRILTGFLFTLTLTILIYLTWLHVSYWKNSETLFEHTLEVTSNNYLAHYNLGITLFEKGDIDGAIKQYEEALLINPRITQAHNNLGCILYQRGNTDAAIGHFLTALQINPHQANGYYNLGTVYYTKGKIKKSVEYFQKAININPSFYEAIQKLAIARNDLKKLEAQMSMIKSAIKQEPNNPDLYIKLGDIFQQQEDINEAKEEYQKAVLIRPELSQALYRLAQVYVVCQEYANALDIFQRMIQLQPDNPKIYYNVACIYSKQKMVNESINWLKKSIDKGFNDWELIKKDPDLDSIRNNPYVINLIKYH